MKEKSYHTVTDKKILKILTGRGRLSRSKIMVLAKMPRKRCADSLDDLAKAQFVRLEDEECEITEVGMAYLSEMQKRDKRGRQMRRQISGRSN
jgi:predicted transcriptional regulator